MAIDQALGVNIEDIIVKAEVTEWFEEGYIRPECLVYLIRNARRNGDDDIMGRLLFQLWKRCEEKLKKRFCNHPAGVAEEITGKILCDLTELFMKDGEGEMPDKLDFFECRFNSAFKDFRIDRTPKKKSKTNEIDQADSDRPGEINEFKTIPFSSLQITEGLIEDELARRYEQFRVDPTQEHEAFGVELAAAVRSLPPDEQQAIFLYYFRGYQEDSKFIDEPTVASICGVTGRTVQNRLNRAYQKLSKILEGS